MKDILTDILANKQLEVAMQKQVISIEQLLEEIEDAPAVHSMRQALLDSQSGIIAEFKRRSPSKGWIHRNAEAGDVVPFYVSAGAAALSILTDKEFFGGTLKDIRTVRSHIDIPILRKDFIIDEYQLYQSRMVGADAILLIAAALKESECQELIGRAHELGLEVLLELHHESELSYITDEVDMIGINNRNLGTFVTDVENSFRLAGQLPQDTVLVSESGISNPQTVRRLRQKGFKGFLIGETFMKTPQPDEALQKFIAEMR